MSLTPADGPGRRDNGLSAAEWGALVDVDPRLSEALLDSLRDQGVPAYVEPARDLNTLLQNATLPKRPLDRLWVDPGHAALARMVVTSEVQDLTALLAESEPGMTAHGLVRPVPRTAASRVLTPPELPDPPLARPAAPAAPQLSDDELFAQIIAGFDTETADPVRPRVDPPSPTPAPAPQLRRRSDPVDDALPPWVEPAALVDDGHFDPPVAPKVPRVRLRTVGAVVMIVLGLLMVLAPSRVGLSDDVGILLIGLSLTLGGAALLVWWMRDAPPTDSGWDDGAVV